MINATDMYADFKRRNPGTDVTYVMFKHILSEYNQGIVDTLMKGETFNLGVRLGKLRIRKVARNFNRKTVDWGETNKLAKQGIKQLVYFTDEYYYGFFWEKRYCTIKNKSVYKFHPAGGQEGPKKRLIRFLKEDELNCLNFKE